MVRKIRLRFEVLSSNPCQFLISCEKSCALNIISWWRDASWARYVCWTSVMSNIQVVECFTPARELCVPRTPSMHTLPETVRLPCAAQFVVGQTSGTRQRLGLPCATRLSTRQRFGTRQRERLPCASTKDPRQRMRTRQRKDLCRVPNIGHTAKMAASDAVWSTVTFAVCLNKALGKVSSCRVFYFVHTAKVFQNSWILTPQIFWYKNTGYFAPC